MQLISTSLRCAAQVRSSPLTGREELVVLGGQTDKGLVSMEPLTLDLTRFYWRCWHVSQPCPWHAYAVADAPHRAVLRPRSDYLPAPRQRTAAERVSRRWLLMVGGSSPEVWKALEGSVGGTWHCTPHSSCLPPFTAG